MSSPARATGDRPRVVVVGIDCLTPQFALEQWRDDLPHLSGLAARGVSGRLESTLPPITVPAWTAMMTSKDPGTLGVYGFRNRVGHGYDTLAIATSAAVKEPTVWDILSRHGLKSLVVGVPQTYPPKPLNGVMVSCFMTPNKQVQYTHPAGIQQVLDRIAGGEYVIDVKDFRTDDKLALLAAVEQMTEARFRAFRGLMRADDFDFAMMVEMGVDRLHHGFWRYCDPSHRLYEPGNPYAQVLHDYYVKVDAELGRTIEAAGEGASVLVVSDHGAKAMEGGICINEWLQMNGYLKLKEQPREQVRLTPDLIDWPNTTAWGEGGYYGRLFLNVAGREPQGLVPAADYERVRDEIAAGLEAFGDEEGRPIGTRAYRPEQVYRHVNGTPPDLIVYFGDLNWRSVGTVGIGAPHLRENDTGPDDANHQQDGVLVWQVGAGRTARPAERYRIYDVAPSLLDYFGIEAPADMVGESILT
jgi:predicted AlkP superfamily phosphohydrolase/phosphomutase